MNILHKTVWHKSIYCSYGKGTVTDENNWCVFVAFDDENIGIREFSKEAWGTFLFLSKKDSNAKDRQSIKEKYRELYEIPDVQANIRAEAEKEKAREREMIHAAIEEEEKNTYREYTVDDKCLFPSFEGASKRNIVIALNRTVCRYNKRYILLLGIDVFTGKLVNIVDTNGSYFGMHSYHEDIARLKCQTVIQAEFKIFESQYYINTVRIVSQIRKLGNSSISKLHNKYEELCDRTYDFIHDFGDLTEFSETHRNSFGYFYVNFTGTKIQAYKCKYQIKMDKYFIDIDDPRFNSKKNCDKYYRGWTILQCEFQDRIMFHALALHGKTSDKPFERNDGQEDFERYFEEYIYESELFEEFFGEEDDSYEQDYLDELIGAYEDYSSDILEDYNEYSEDEDYGERP